MTSAFAAYVSGHSTFSRTDAEVMALFTGDKYFPGGMGRRRSTQAGSNSKTDRPDAITLQWATYFDAADHDGVLSPLDAILVINDLPSSTLLIPPVPEPAGWQLTITLWFGFVGTWQRRFLPPHRSIRFASAL